MNVNDLCPHCMREKGNGNGRCRHCGYENGKGSMLQHQLKPFTILSGKYLVGDILGEGGFGITYIGFDLNLEIRIAIKEFYPTGYVTRESGVTNMVTAYTGSGTDIFNKWLQNFMKEARSLAKCSHLPGIVGVKDFFQENNTAYIVMEYLDGMNVKDFAKANGGRIETQQLLQLFQPVLNSLESVHKAGLIHRDISPDNIMLLNDGTMKLLDFGAAREFTNEGEKSLSVLLKPGYAPEEQYRTKGKQGPWSDVYAICATIYRCITGITPPESMERMRKDELKKPSELGAAISKEAEEALLKGMAVFAENRYQSIEELMKELYNNAAVQKKSIITEKPERAESERTESERIKSEGTESEKIKSEETELEGTESKGTDPGKAAFPWDKIRNKKLLLGSAAAVGILICILMIRAFSSEDKIPQTTAVAQTQTESAAEAVFTGEFTEEETIQLEILAGYLFEAGFSYGKDENDIEKKGFAEYVMSLLFNAQVYENQFQLDNFAEAGSERNSCYVINRENVQKISNMLFGKQAAEEEFIFDNDMYTADSSWNKKEWPHVKIAEITNTDGKIIIEGFGYMDVYAGQEKTYDSYPCYFQIKCRPNQESLFYGMTIDSFEIRDAETIKRSSARASSSLQPYNTITYDVSNALDGNYTTAWQEGIEGTGIGQWIQFGFPRQEMLCGLAVKNGYAKSEELYKNNGKILSFYAEFSDGSGQEITFDKYDVEEISPTYYVAEGFNVYLFEQPVMTESLKLTITDALKGEKYDDTGVSEVIFLSLNAQNDSDDSTVIPENTVVQETYRYEFITKDITWEDANLECAAKGGHLADINSEEEYDIITEQLESQGLGGFRFWIGGKRPVGSDGYYWTYPDGRINGAAVNSEEYAGCWLAGEPSFYSEDMEENYMIMFFHKDIGKWVWNDVGNDVISQAASYAGKIGYICEYDS